jgi:hypothetical protein
MASLILFASTQIWSEGSILHLLETTSLHGEFHADPTFGTLQWSRDETKVVYIAERKRQEDGIEVSRTPKVKPTKVNVILMTNILITRILCGNRNMTINQTGEKLLLESVIRRSWSSISTPWKSRFWTPLRAT